VQQALELTRVERPTAKEALGASGGATGSWRASQPPAERMRSVAFATWNTSP